MEKSSASGHSPEPSAPPARDVVTVPSRQGLEAVDLLRLSTGVGPVFHASTGDSLAFLVPPGTADRWDLPGSQCHRTGGDLTPCSSGWVVPPCTDRAVTDPAVLREALGEAARTIELADGFAQQPSAPSSP